MADLSNRQTPQSRLKKNAGIDSQRLDSNILSIFR